MDNTTLMIVLGSSVLIILLVIWKIAWLMKKINSAPVPGKTATPERFTPVGRGTAAPVCRQSPGSGGLSGQHRADPAAVHTHSLTITRCCMPHGSSHAVRNHEPHRSCCLYPCRHCTADLSDNVSGQRLWGCFINAREPFTHSGTFN